MENLAYYNGKISLISEMMIPATDRAVYFGDGVYDAAVIVNHTPFDIDAHIDRFYNSLAGIKIKFEMTKTELKALLLDLISKVDGGEMMLYWQCSRGAYPRGHAFPPIDTPPCLMAFLTPFKVQKLNRTKKLATIEDTRYLHCNVKTLNLLPNIMAAEFAREQGCDEVVFHRGEIVTEGCHSNIMIIKDGALYSHPADNMILPGITRAHLLKLAPTVGLVAKEEKFTLADLFEADEVIVTSSGTLCNAVATVDGKPVGGKAVELLQKLQNAYGAKFNEVTGGNIF